MWFGSNVNVGYAKTGDAGDRPTADTEEAGGWGGAPR